MRLQGWALIQCDWHPYENRKFGHMERHKGYICTEERTFKDTKRRLSACQKERPWKKPTLRRNQTDTL